SSGEAQAKRLERVYEEVAKLLREPGVAALLRTPPGGSEWSAMQTLGHTTEMIPLLVEPLSDPNRRHGDTADVRARRRVAGEIGGDRSRSERRLGRPPGPVARGSSDGGKHDPAVLCRRARQTWHLNRGRRDDRRPGDRVVHCC